MPENADREAKLSGFDVDELRGIDAFDVVPFEWDAKML